MDSRRLEWRRGLLARVPTPARALLAGAISGATLGLVQWLVLRMRLPFLPFWWVFGLVGAWVFELVTGLTLHFLLRSTSGMK